MSALKKYLVLAAAGVLLAACTTDETTAPSVDAPLLLEGQSALEDAIDQLTIDAFPRGLETATGTRWSNIRGKAAAGNTAEAYQMFADLAKFIQQKVPQMDPLPTGETGQAAAARLVFYMATFLGSGGATVPQVGDDLAFGVVLPDAPATIVTPSGDAGVEFVAGSVAVPTVVTVSENAQYYGLCAGPLVTTLCQYPLYYRFDAVPHVKLLQPAKFGVCHAMLGSRTPGEAHDHLRLAHDLPADPANYTTGAIQREGIEILPPVEVEFLSCAGATYPDAPIQIGDASAFSRALATVASAARTTLRYFAPTPAFAMRRIDQGVGGESTFFSSFNLVEYHESDVIDFETNADGSPVDCLSGCSITNQYAPLGLAFAFEPASEGGPTHVTLGRSGNNPEGSATNHEISNPWLPAGGQYGGNMNLLFSGVPTTVTFEVRLNNGAPPVPVTVYGVPTSTSDGPLPVNATVTRQTVVYPDNPNAVQYRQETITVTYAGGITRIHLTGMLPQAYTLLVDDVDIGPGVPIIP